MQGCCIALALAAKGVRVTLVDRNDRLLSRAAVINEGKIHLGYMYAGDPSLATARTMITGALAFAPFMARHLALAADGMQTSSPAVYLVHRDGQQGPEVVGRYLSAVHDLVRQAAEAMPGSYFGRDLRPPPRAWSAAERYAVFDPSLAPAAFDTPEIAIDPVALAAAVRRCVAADPAIEVRLRHVVLSVEEHRSGLSVRSDGEDGKSSDRYDHVVNALWDGRLAIDATLGLRPGRPWLHRFKYGVRLRTGAAQPPMTVTIVLGPFGEIVNYGGGAMYLTWYPACLSGRSDEVAPPEWPMHPPEPQRGNLIAGTIAGLAEIVPALGRLEPGDLSDASVGGGVIVAWGETDIDDPGSELHQRFAIGITSHGRYHSVDPGKLTMAPYFADLCARRIVGE